MNLHEETKAFYDKYMNQTNNVFDAINLWVDESNSLNSKYLNKLSDAEALSSVLNGKLPENINNRKVVKEVEANYASRYIDEVLSEIDDNLIKISIMKSLDLSKLKKNLVFKYADGLSRAQKARVRIVCKLIWYNLYPMKG